MTQSEVTVRTGGGERTYLVRDLGIIENGLYRIMGSMPQHCIQDDRFRLERQFRSCGISDITPGYRLVAQALRETEKHAKFDYVLIPGIILNYTRDEKESLSPTP